MMAILPDTRYAQGCVRRLKTDQDVMASKRVSVNFFMEWIVDMKPEETHVFQQANGMQLRAVQFLIEKMKFINL
jgi:hypothetical protein